MRIALLNKNNRVTNVLALAPGVRPEDLKRVETWRELPNHPITPGASARTLVSRLFLLSNAIRIVIIPGRGLISRLAAEDR